MASSIETTSTTTTLKNNGNTYLSVDTNDDVAITNTLTATSPTFVTPALGTPASGTLTNCSFPTLNQNTSGTAAGLSATLAVGSGGTGVTSSTGSGNNVLSASPTLTGTIGAAALTLTTPLPAASGGTGRTSGAGKVLQVLNGNSTAAYTTTSQSYVIPTGVSIAITPSSTSSKILVMCTSQFGISGDAGHAYARLQRDGAVILEGDAAGSRPRTYVVQNNFGGNAPPNYHMVALDSPSTTSAVTYSLGVRSSNGTTVYLNRGVRDNDGSQYDARTASTIIVMEIVG
jgi:hypothetical protein